MLSTEFVSLYISRNGFGKCLRILQSRSLKISLTLNLAAYVDSKTSL